MRSPINIPLNVHVKIVKMVAISILSIYLSIDTQLSDTRSFTGLSKRNGCNDFEPVDDLVS